MSGAADAFYHDPNTKKFGAIGSGQDFARPWAELRRESHYARAWIAISPGSDRQDAKTPEPRRGDIGEGQHASSITQVFSVWVWRFRWSLACAVIVPRVKMETQARTGPLGSRFQESMMAWSTFETGRSQPTHLRPPTELH